ncbi:hypothetical protein GCM10011320_32720 [Neoroseomonas lacus]|uniref:Uncharacterized protein n=1 Tax=Neoroseomonas lacus TaxID=287609 RepID=A0A917KQE3_9PROT|nr:hypothetical protein GCM10011320_32720 [Neoroseomonas lacus]
MDTTNGLMPPFPVLALPRATGRRINRHVTSIAGRAAEDLRHATGRIAVIDIPDGDCLSGHLGVGYLGAAIACRAGFVGGRHGATDG